MKFLRIIIIIFIFLSTHQIAYSNIEIEANQVGELVMDELKKIDKVAFIRFASVYREFKDIGEFQAQIEDLKK